jgi:DNA polymerase I-like protein with 3'-5' exonuclease and polymerase domains
MLFPVHDEIDLSVPDDRLDDVRTTLLDVVNDDRLLSVPLTWSAEVGPNWGECS